MTRLVTFPSSLGHEDGDELLIAKLSHTNPFQSQRSKESAVWLFLQGLKVHGAASQVSAGRSFGDDEGEFRLDHYAAAVNLLPSRWLLTPETTAFFKDQLPTIFVYSRRTAQSSTA